MLVEKSKRSKDVSYPLRSSFLADALATAGVEIDTHLIIAPSEIFLDAHFWPPNARVSNERLYVRAGTVPDQVAREARQYMESTVVPDLVRWIAEICSLSPQSPTRASEQYFRRDWPRTGA